MCTTVTPESDKGVLAIIKVLQLYQQPNECRPLQSNQSSQLNLHLLLDDQKKDSKVNKSQNIWAVMAPHLISSGVSILIVQFMAQMPGNRI